MAVDYNRQYIGARYVPMLFKSPDGSMEWQTNTYYEPLTIVTYNNGSYISRTSVPNNIGNPSDNKNFWAFTGSSNAMIRDLQNQINDIKETNAKSHTLKNRNFLVLADSFGDPSIGVIGWPTVFNDIMKQYKIPVTTRAYGGTGWANKTYKTWLQLLNEVGPLDGFTDIIIGGGSNDRIQTQDDLGAAMTQMRNYLLPYNINLTYFHWGNTLDSSTRNLFNDLYFRIKNAAYSAQISFVPTAIQAMHNKGYFQDDKIHPTQECSNFLAYFVYQYFMGETPTYTAHTDDNNIEVWVNGMEVAFSIKTRNLGITSLSTGTRVKLSFTAPSNIIPTGEQLFQTTGYILNGSDVIIADFYITFQPNRDILLGARFEGTADNITAISFNQNVFYSDIFHM